LKERFDEQGDSLVFTPPPYAPVLLKGYVARKFFLGRTVPQTREHIREGFSGGRKRLEWLPRDLQEAHPENPSLLVDSDPELSGTIHHLQVKNAELSEDLLAIETDMADNARLKGVSDVHFSGVNDYDSDNDDEFGGMI
jgi:hypothetical protein